MFQGDSLVSSRKAPPTMENRRETQMLQKLRSQALRTKERNLAERRFLDRKLQTITWRQRMSDHVIEKEVKELRDSLRRQALLAQDASDEEEDTPDTSNILLPNLPSQGQHKVTPQGQAKVNEHSKISLRGNSRDKARADITGRSKSAPNRDITSRTSSRTSSVRSGGSSARWRRGGRKREEPMCRYGPLTRCRHFPCVSPSSYTSLGYEVDRARPSKDIVSTASLVSAAHRERLLADLESSSVRRPLRSSMDQCVQKEQSLKKIIAEMKVRSEAGRPPDWCINYGTPTPHRKLFKVARPSAGSEDLAGL